MSDQSGRTAGIVIGGFALVAVVAIAIAIVALQKGSQNVDKIHRLEHQVHVLAAASGGATKSVGSRVGTLEQQVSTLEEKGTAAVAKQAKTDAAVRGLVTCVPEIQSQIGSLEIVLGNPPYIKDASNVSKTCSNLLYGTGG